MSDHDLPTHTEGEGETLDMPEGFQSFTSGQVLGERYQILEMLGRGGMGEVWHAFDLKLRVDVALKALREDLFKSERRLELLRQEVRAAREVVSPNVCRIFDLIEVEDRELVSMEYVDGATLLGVLQERGPLELKEAQDIASQFLAGLEAIHKAGLIHRDIKPENIMLTRAGRVVVMDFGLARQETEGGGTVSGTPAYMAPEQAAGQTVDARADVYAAGVVLAEMVSPDGIKSYESRQSLWEDVRSEPAKLPDSPWAPAIKKAVAKDREQRYHTAHTLTRALEDVTLRVEGAEDLHPYPGLASFTESDAEYFFGREAEVEQMWRKLEGPPRMLGLVGPSGAGKTSFLRAGILPSTSSAWVVVRCTPGTDPFVSLGQTLAPVIAGDAGAMRLLPRVHESDSAVELVQRWSRSGSHAVLIIDQFEELFTLNAEEPQSGFASLLARLPLEADVHVLLSMRDDFLMLCNRHEGLRPIVHGLTLLDPPTGTNLRRALVQPATKCGYRFEDDELVEEMLAEVEGERGALPLLAFAAARLWEQRDRDTGLLTRQAYHDIGGVGGALARHAEATIDRIGSQHIGVVRELFRNLVTAEGTRAVREWNDLLSIFRNSQGESPEEVLRQLIDARLLTSYEVQAEDEAPTRSVEIIHESLLANWPRLVRWQTQDEEGAQLRDELRQSARAWDEHGRHDDRLWTGTAFREYVLWRERYPGGISDLEEAYGSAMTALAGRRRRRRRMVVAAVMAALVAGLAVVGTFWQRSVRETRRAEAAKLVALGQVELMSPNVDSTGTVAYALASLEMTDSNEARLLALEALWMRPPRQTIPIGGGFGLDFSPDGRRLAVGLSGEKIGIWESSGGAPTFLQAENTGDSYVTWVQFADDSDVLFTSTGYPAHGARMWSLSDLSLLRSFEFSGKRSSGKLNEKRRQLITWVESVDGSRVKLKSWPLADGDPIDLGDLPLHGWPDVDPTGNLLAYPTGKDLDLRQLENLAVRDTVPLDRHDHDVEGVTFDEQGTRVAVKDKSGTIRVWSLAESTPRLLRTLESGCGTPEMAFNDDGSLLAVSCIEVQIWDLDAPPDAAPLKLGSSGGSKFLASFDPRGRWVAVTTFSSIGISLLDRRYPAVMAGHEAAPMSLVFAPDGSWLASASWEGTVRLWPLSSEAGLRGRILFSIEGQKRKIFSLAVSPDGQFLIAGTDGGEVWLVPVNGDSPRLVGRTNGFVQAVSISPDAGTIATGGGFLTPGERIIRLWDVDSGHQRQLDPGDEGDVSDLEFTGDGSLFSASGGRLRRWNLEDGTSEVLIDDGVKSFDISADENSVLWKGGGTWGGGPVSHMNLVDGGTRALQGFGQASRSAVALDATGTVAVIGGDDRTLRVGFVAGGEPHLLLSPGGSLWSVAFSPDGRWIASAGGDRFVRLWPMPDLSKPPLHTLPREELIAKLKTLTNLRVVRDEESATGWKLEVGPFPGWETVPTW